MTHIVPTLKKDSTRSLCDQFTNIFYVDEVPSSSIDLASFTASVSYPSPAASSEESDDSLLADTLSPPSSPWFPSMSSTADNLLKTSSKTIAAGEDVDFFRNPFYRSLHHHQQGSAESVYPESLLVQRRKVSLPQAVKSSRDRSSSGQEVSQTAAPSDLFNISLDQILSAGPFNLSLETQQMLLSAVEEAFPSSQEEGQQQQQQYDGSSPSQEEFDMIEDTLTTGSLSAPEDTEDEDVESMEYGQAQHQHSAEHSLEPELDDHSDSDYRESTPVQQKKARSSAAAKKKTPRGTSSTTTGKAPRVRKGTYKRSLKVYPPRRPKANIISEGLLESDDCDVKIKAESSNGVKLPGGLRLPLDKDGYLCEHCPKERFGRVHDLKRHQISKHNERTWPCDFCHRPFVRRDALLRHYAVKTARKDGVHPTAEDVDRLSEARARARLI
ncbi:hypothetical protein BGZ95_009111 [Linnemannia exigua]|uniref:C2H2-type domain-containing protein n=1 Tax=Linnemannia exigua TaxID=604196 RepID=A0AAD4H6Z8_9FUNG|nr:hypothetical protein BGZ95_009111 [Linnemannia exigua]